MPFLMPDSYEKKKEDGFLMPDGYESVEKVKLNHNLLAGKNIDSTAKIQNTADKLKIPTTRVESDPEHYQAQLEKPDFIELNKTSPSTVKYLADKGNAMFSLDDTQELAEVENTFLRGGKAVLRSTPRGVYTLGKAANDALAFTTGLIDETVEGLANLTGMEKGGLFESIQDWALNASKEQGKILSGDKEVLGLNLGLSDAVKDKRLIENPDLLLDPEWMVQNFSDAVSSMIPIMAAHYATGGSTTAAGFLGGVQEGTALYSEMMEEDKVSRARALEATMAFGTVSAYLNKIGLDKILDKTPAKNLKNRIFKSLIKGGVEAGTEWAEEPAQALIKSLAEENTPTETLESVKQALTNIDVMPGAFLLGGGMAYQSQGNQYQQEKQAKEFKELHQKIGEAVDQTKTKARSPEHLETFFQTMGFGEESFITSEGIETLYQNNPEIAEKLGLDEETALNNAGLGIDTIIDTKKIHSRLEPEERELILDNLKPAPGAMSIKELEGIDIENDLAELVDKFSDNIEDEVSFKNEINRIKTELVEAGVNDEAVEAQSKLLEGHANRMAAMGVDRKETLSKLKVRRMSFEDFEKEQGGGSDKIFFQSPLTESKDSKSNFKKWSKDYDVIEGYEIADAESDRGAVFRVYHGTTNEFNIFDPSVKGTKESHFGQVNYFTSDVGDADLNYAGEGPDLTNRIEQRKEQLEQEIYTLTWEEIQKKLKLPKEFTDNSSQDKILEYAAKQELVGGEPQTMDVFVRLDNPAYIGGKTETWIEDFDNEAIREDAKEQILEENGADESQLEEFEDEITDREYEIQANTESEIYNAIEQALYEVETFDSVNAQDIYAELELYDGEITATELDSKLRESSILLDAMDLENGGLLSNHIIGLIFKNLGYDGIVLQNANQQFPGMNMGGETSHVHVFDTPTQIKSATDNNGQYSETNPNIYYQSEEEIQQPVWYSQMRNTLESKLNNGKPKAIKQQLESWANKGLFKKEELEWSGLNEWLDTQKGKVKKQDVLDYLEQNQVAIEEVVKGGDYEVSSIKSLGGEYPTVYTVTFNDGVTTEVDLSSQYNDALDPTDAEIEEIAIDQRKADDLSVEGDLSGDTKFSQYQLPGGENYKEILLRMPKKRQVMSKEEYAEAYDQPFTELEAQYEAYINDKGVDEGAYNSPHWDESNVLAHIRMSEREVDGKKVLHIEEVQSDWHQEGRKKGYQKGDAYILMSQTGTRTLHGNVESGGSKYFNSYAAAKKVADETGFTIKKVTPEGVPNAPFKKTWQMLAIKRMVRYAAENGFDSLAWTQGEQQAERYDLSKQVDSVVYYPKDKLLQAFKNNSSVLTQENVSQDKLSDYIGKEAADKIINNPTSKGATANTLTGADLKVGGEGMKGFYDKILPSEVNKFFNKKAWGKAKVGEVEIETEKTYEGGVPSMYPKKEKLHSLPITPEMKQKALNQGMPLFQDKKGATQIFDQAYIVSLFEKADASTLVHETGHIFLKEMETAINEGLASDSMVKDYDTVLDWLGAERGKPLTVEQNEQFAKGFEAYLMEGKAPSSSLESAFEKFRKWLLEIYKTIGLDVELTDEIREVFDRMLVVEEEIINSASDIGMEMPTQKTMNKLGISDADRKYMERRLQTAKDQAEKKLIKARNKNYKANIKKWVKEAKEQYESLPGVKLTKALEENGLNTARMKEIYGEEAFSKIPGKVLSEDGKDPEIVASKHGYDTIDELILDIYSTPDQKDFVSGYVESKQAEIDLKYTAAEFLVGSSAYADYLYVLAKYEKKNSTAKIPTPKAFKVAAEKIFKNYPIRKATRVDRFMSAIKKHSIQKTKRADEKVRMNHELARLSIKQRKEVEKTLKLAGTIFKAKIKNDYKQQALRIIERFGLSNRQIAIDIDRPTISEFFAKLQTNTDIEFGDVLPTYSDMFMIDQATYDYRDLTTEKFSELQELLTYLKKRGYKAKHKFLADGKTKVLDMAKKLAEPMLNLKRTKRKVTENAIGEKLTDFSRRFFASQESLIWIFRRADGYRANVARWIGRGRNEQHLTNRLTDAGNVFTNMSEKYAKKLTPIFDYFQKRGKDFDKSILDTGVPVPEIMTRTKNRSWNFERILAIALNMGNEVNRSRIELGYGLKPEHQQALISKLNNEDWAKIQEIWDIIESLRDPLFTTFKKINDFTPHTVEANPFTTPTGLELKGGYYPLKYDPSLSRRTEEWNETDDLMSSTEAMFPSANPKQGMTQQRTKGVSLPVKLDLNVLVGHINDTIRYISHAEAVNDINLITKQEIYKNAMDKAEGEFLYKEIRPALAAIARPGELNLSQTDSIALKETMRATAYILGLNTSVALKQPFSVFAYVSDVGETNPLKGAYWGLRGIAKVMQHPYEAMKAMHEISPYMRERSNRIDRDFGKKNFVSKGKKKFQAVQDAMFILIKTMDFVTVYPSWNGAYLKGMKDFQGDKAKAVKYADSIIRHTQPSAQEIDMNRLQRDKKGMHRLFTMFSTFTFKAGQYQRYDYNQWKQGNLTHLQYLSTIAVKQIAPPIMMNLMFCALWGDEPDPKDLLIDTLAYQFLGIFVVRELSGAISQAFKEDGFKSDNPFDSAILSGGKLIMRFVNGIIGAIEDLGDDEKMEKAVLAFAEIFSYWVKLPVPKLYRKTMQGIEQYENGDGTPMNILVRNPKIR